MCMRKSGNREYHDGTVELSKDPNPVNPFISQPEERSHSAELSTGLIGAFKHRGKLAVYLSDVSKLLYKANSLPLETQQQKWQEIAQKNGEVTFHSFAKRLGKFLTNEIGNW